MPPALAAFLTVTFCGFMLWRDTRRQPRVAGSLWLAVAWMFFIGSRFVGQWLDLFGLNPFGGSSAEDGSAIDAAFFLCLICAAVVVLLRRRVRFTTFARNNAWLTIFFVYCFIAIWWSDFPFVALKRWVKILGHPAMALIVLTDAHPREALRAVLRRSAYLHLPLSILFIKYYPQWGRGFDSWTGQAINRGINLNKNELGYACMVFGLFFLWNLMACRRRYREQPGREALLSATFIAMIGWLFSLAGSATALLCTAIGVATMAVVSSRLVSKRFVGTYLVVTILLIALCENVFGVYGAVLDSVGRDATLTDRTQIWHDVLAIPINPIFGAGFESFWLGPRLDALWAKWWWHPNQAHDGYLETYLNLGWVGVALLASLLVATFRKARLALLRDIDVGRFRLGVLLAIVAYNYTEAAFKGVHLVWTLFHLIAIDYPEIGATGASQVVAVPASSLFLQPFEPESHGAIHRHHSCTQ